MSLHRNPLACLIAGAVLALALSACNTVEGAGKDIEKVGQKIEDKARRVAN